LPQDVFGKHATAEVDSPIHQLKQHRNMFALWRIPCAAVNEFNTYRGHGGVSMGAQQRPSGSDSAPEF